MAPCGAHPIRTPAVAATDNARLAPESPHRLLIDGVAENWAFEDLLLLGKRRSHTRKAPPAALRLCAVR